MDGGYLRLPDYVAPRQTRFDNAFAGSPCHAPSPVSRHGRRQGRKPSLKRPFGRISPQRSPGTSPRGGQERLQRTLTTINETITPCTENKYYNKYVLTGSSLMRAVEEACLDPARDPDEHLDCAMLLDDHSKAWFATYDSFKSSVIKVHAMHLAASLGSISVMEWLIHKLGDDVLDERAEMFRSKAMLERGESILHYTPLMSAMFMSKTEAILWLLDEGADPGIPNCDGLLPLHLFAWNGFPHEHVEKRMDALEKVAMKLVEKQADLQAVSGAFPDRTDPEAELLRKKTPLSIAVKPNNAYPKQMLHLLTTSFHYPADSKLLDDLEIIATANPTAATHLLCSDTTKRFTNPAQTERLRKEVMGQVEKEEHMRIMLLLLRKAPVAGAELLKLLMFEPLVRNPMRYGLPLFTKLENGVMHCTYQPAQRKGVPEWAQDETTAPPTAPRWHCELKVDLPDEPLLDDKVYEVKVRVLHMPGILDLRVLGILSMLWPYWNHMKIFATVPVQAVVTCMWHNLSQVYYFHLAWEVLLLLVLLSIGVFPPEGWPILCKFYRRVIFAYLICTVFNFVTTVLACEQRALIPRMKFIYVFAKGQLCFMVVCSLLVHVRIPLQTGLEKFIVASSILIVSSSIVAMFRSVRGFGQLIIAVMHSFVPMVDMFMLMAIFFLTCWFAFVTMKDSDRSNFFEFLYLYRALFLSDDGAAQAISGFDVAREQTLDYGQELYTGGGDRWLLYGSTAMMTFATTVFTIVLLNLIIGMYTKYYEDMKAFANLLFQRQRAHTCVHYMLRPSLPPQYKHWRPNGILLAMFCVFIFFVELVLGVDDPASVLNMGKFGAIFLAAGVLIFQATALTDTRYVDENNHYLWVSYRSDYDEEFYRGERERELSTLQREVTEAIVLNRDAINEIRREVEVLTADFEESRIQWSETLHTLRGVAERLSPFDNSPMVIGGRAAPQGVASLPKNISTLAQDGTPQESASSVPESRRSGSRSI